MVYVAVFVVVFHSALLIVALATLTLLVRILLPSIPLVSEYEIVKVELFAVLVISDATTVPLIGAVVSISISKPDETGLSFPAISNAFAVIV